MLSYVAFVTVAFSATKTGDLRTKGVPKKEIYIWYIYNKKEKCKKTKQEMAQDIGENAR